MKPIVLILTVLFFIGCKEEVIEPVQVQMFSSTSKVTIRVEDGYNYPTLIYITPGQIYTYKIMEGTLLHLVSNFDTEFYINSDILNIKARTKTKYRIKAGDMVLLGDPVHVE